jgi:protein-S-isoprenylcysteine O-methyltransferase Ste14
MTRLPDLGSRGQGWVAIQVVLTILLVGLGLSDAGAWPLPMAIVSAIAGIVLLVAGGALTARAIRDLGRNLTAVPHPREGSVLVRQGAFGLVRHPIYGGQVIMALGWGLALASPAGLLMAVLLGVFFDLKTRREEAWLSERYADYPAYAASTRRLIPWLY